MSSDPGETSALSGGSPTHPKRHQQRQRRQQQRCRPTCGCLMITVAFTLLGTAVIILSWTCKCLKLELVFLQSYSRHSQPQYLLIIGKGSTTTPVRLTPSPVATTQLIDLRGSLIKP